MIPINIFLPKFDRLSPGFLKKKGKKYLLISRFNCLSVINYDNLKQTGQTPIFHPRKNLSSILNCGNRIFILVSSSIYMLENFVPLSRLKLSKDPIEKIINFRNYLVFHIPKKHEIGIFDYRKMTWGGILQVDTNFIDFEVEVSDGNKKLIYILKKKGVIEIFNLKNLSNFTRISLPLRKGAVFLKQNIEGKIFTVFFSKGFIFLIDLIRNNYFERFTNEKINNYTDFLFLRDNGFIIVRKGKNILIKNSSKLNFKQFKMKGNDSKFRIFNYPKIDSTLFFFIFQNSEVRLYEFNSKKNNFSFLSSLKPQTGFVPFFKNINYQGGVFLCTDTRNKLELMCYRQANMNLLFRWKINLRKIPLNYLKHKEINGGFNRNMLVNKMKIISKGKKISQIILVVGFFNSIYPWMFKIKGILRIQFIINFIRKSISNENLDKISSFSSLGCLYLGFSKGSFLFIKLENFQIYGYSNSKYHNQCFLTVCKILNPCFSGDSQFFLTSCENGDLNLWNIKKFKKIFNRKLNIEIDHVIWDSKVDIILISSKNFFISIFQPNYLKCVKLLFSHTSPISCLSMIYSGSNLLTCGFDKKVILWGIWDQRPFCKFKCEFPIKTLSGLKLGDYLLSTHLNTASLGLWGNVDHCYFKTKGRFNNQIVSKPRFAENNKYSIFNINKVLF